MHPPTPRRGWLGRVAAGLFVSAFALACPGVLEHPERFLDSGQPALTCPGSIDVVTTVIQAKCATAGCHNTATHAGTLDLEAANPASRLLGVASSCMDLPLASGDGSGFFIDKVSMPTPQCGSRMPLGGMLTDDEVTCLKVFLISAADGGTS